MSLANVQVHLVDSFDVAADMYRWLSTRGRVAIDTEGTGLSPEVDRVRTLQLGDQDRAYVIPIEFPGWGALAVEVLQRFQGRYVAHNLTYDAAMIKSTLGVDLPKHRCDDTRLMAHVLESTGSIALKKLAVRHVDPRANVGQQQLDDAIGKLGGWTWATVPITFEPYWFYGGLDTIITYRLAKVLEPRVAAEAPRSYELELAVSWVANQMERRGVRVDRDYTTRLIETYEDYVQRATEWCQKNYRVDPGSNREIARGLRDDSVELSKLTGGGEYCVDKYVLGAIDHPLAKVALRRRQAVKTVSTYLVHYLEMSERDGRIHPSINTIGGMGKNPFEPGGSSGVRTGRMSMSNPNLQNVPIRTREGKMIRNCFIASEDHSWIKADADQIEMRGMAHVSGEQGMIDAFKTPGDFFVNMARTLFNEPDFVKSDPRRQMVKNGNYAKIYGAGIPKFAATAGVSIEEAASFMRAFDAMYPRVAAWIREVERDARRRLDDEGEAYIRSPLTNRKHIADAGKLYTLVNYDVQGMAGEILKMKMVEADQAGLGDYMIIPVHDEIDSDVPNDRLDDARDTFASILNDDQLLSVPITWSIETGQRWGECS